MVKYDTVGVSPCESIDTCGMCRMIMPHNNSGEVRMRVSHTLPTRLIGFWSRHHSRSGLVDGLALFSAIVVVVLDVNAAIRFEDLPVEDRESIERDVALETTILALTNEPSSTGVAVADWWLRQVSDATSVVKPALFVRSVCDPTGTLDLISNTLNSTKSPFRELYLEWLCSDSANRNLGRKAVNDVVLMCLRKWHFDDPLLPMLLNCAVTLGSGDGALRDELESMRLRSSIPEYVREVLIPMALYDSRNTFLAPHPLYLRKVLSDDSSGYISLQVLLRNTEGVSIVAGLPAVTNVLVVVADGIGASKPWPRTRVSRLAPSDISNLGSQAKFNTVEEATIATIRVQRPKVGSRVRLTVRVMVDGVGEGVWWDEF